MKKNSIEATYTRIASELKKLRETYNLLLYVGRFCPMHLGHQGMTGGMIGAYPDNHLLLIGSCNEEMSLRNLFTYTDRNDFIKAIFPNARIAPMPDFEKDDVSWFKALDDLIRLAGGDPKTTAFIGGCEEDVQWYYRMNRNVHIVNRFSGTTVNISGTEIRDHLIKGDKKRLAKLMDPNIIDLVMERFSLRWEEFRRR